MSPLRTAVRVCEQMDATTFAEIRVEGIIEKCPACAHTSWFDKADYRFLSD